jgi:ammonium transporter Rh
MQVKDGDWSPFKFSLELFILGMYSVGSHLITLGGIIGKVSLEQLLVLQIPQTVMFGLNWYVCQLVLRIVDIGGSLIIHVFGCYYGLAATIFLSRRPMKSLQEAHESGYTSDLFSMIGTIFLWVMWPSFNAATALPHIQYRAIINTVLSLCAANVATFAWSSVLRRGKLVMEDVQNATLAGGVAIGAVADLMVGPGGALIVGFFAGSVSVFGFRFLNPWLASKGIYDTCGINNLHGMPGLIGGITAVVVTGIADKATYGNADYAELFYHGSKQWAYQIAAIGITLGIALASGSIFGALASCLPSVRPPFHDSEAWELPASHHLEETDSTPLSEFTDGR